MKVGDKIIIKESVNPSLRGKTGVVINFRGHRGATILVNDWGCGHDGDCNWLPLMLHQSCHFTDSRNLEVID